MTQIPASAKQHFDAIVRNAVRLVDDHRAHAGRFTETLTRLMERVPAGGGPNTGKLWAEALGGADIRLLGREHAFTGLEMLGKLDSAWHGMVTTRTAALDAIRSIPLAINRGYQLGPDDPTTLAHAVDVLERYAKASMHSGTNAYLVPAESGATWVRFRHGRHEVGTWLCNAQRNLSSSASHTPSPAGPLTPDTGRVALSHAPQVPIYNQRHLLPDGRGFGPMYDLVYALEHQGKAVQRSAPLDPSRIREVTEVRRILDFVPPR